MPYWLNSPAKYLKDADGYGDEGRDDEREPGNADLGDGEHFELGMINQSEEEHQTDDGDDQHQDAGEEAFVGLAAVHRVVMARALNYK